MSVAGGGAAAADAASGAPAGAAGKKGGKKKLLILAIPLLLAGAGAGLWFSGILPDLLGTSAKKTEEPPKQATKVDPVFVDMPEMVANLNSPQKRPSYVKLKARVELSKPEDQAPFNAAMPRVVDLFQTYLREMRPDELRGSAGTYRLREELIARASLVSAPAQVVDVLFSELLVQ